MTYLAYSTLRRRRHAEHAATNFYISEGADKRFITDFIGLIDGDFDNVLFNQLLAFIDITPTLVNPDRDLKHLMPWTSRQARTQERCCRMSRQ